MYAVTVSFAIVPGRMAKFLPLIRENAKTSLTLEPGCARFDVCTDPAMPHTVFLFELYEDRAAFEEHLASAHFQSFDRAIAAMVAEKTVQCFERVDQ